MPSQLSEIEVKDDSSKSFILLSKFRVRYRKDLGHWYQTKSIILTYRGSTGIIQSPLF